MSRIQTPHVVMSTLVHVNVNNVVDSCLYGCQDGLIPDVKITAICMQCVNHSNQSVQAAQAAIHIMAGVLSTSDPDKYGCIQCNVRVHDVLDSPRCNSILR